MNNRGLVSTFVSLAIGNVLIAYVLIFFSTFSEPTVNTVVPSPPLPQSVTNLTIPTDLANSTIVAVGAPAENIATGELFSVTLDISGVSLPANAFQFDLSYDEALIELMETESGSFLHVGGRAVICPTAVHPLPGTVRMACTLTGAGPGRTEDGILATLTFRGLSPGISPLTLTTAQLLDTAVPPNPIPLTLQSVQVEIIEIAAIAVDPAIAIAPNGSDIVLSWLPHAFNDLYEVHRSDDPYFIPDASTLYATVAEPTAAYSDTNVSAGATFYIVRAVVSANGSVADSDTVGKFDYALFSGASPASQAAAGGGTIVPAFSSKESTPVAREWSPLLQAGIQNGLPTMLLLLAFGVPLHIAWRRQRRAQARKALSSILVVAMLTNVLAPLAVVSRAAPEEAAVVDQSSQFEATDSDNNVKPGQNNSRLLPPRQAPPVTRSLTATRASGCYGTDIDCDQDVDEGDVSTLAGIWNCASGDACYSADFDLNSDNLIDIVDLAWVANDYDIAPPQITILSPSPGETVTETNITVSGLLSDVHAVDYVTVNGVSATVTIDSFSATITLPGSGNQLLDVVAADVVGLAGSASQIVALDDEGPMIDIHTPLDQQAVYSLTPAIDISYSDFYAAVAAGSLNVSLLDEGGASSDVTGDLVVTDVGVQGMLSAALAEDMTYTMTVSLADEHGNVGTAVSAFYVPLDAGTITPPVATEDAGWVSGHIYDSEDCNDHLDQCEGLAGAQVTLSLIDTEALQQVRVARKLAVENTWRTTNKVLPPMKPAAVKAFASEMSGFVVTGPEGFYTFPVEQSGVYWLRVEKDGYTYGQREIEVVLERSSASNDIFLTPLDPAQTTCDDGGCSHTTSDGSIELEIPAGAIPDGETRDVSATNFEQVEYLPSGDLPAETWETYAFNLGGDSEMTFEEPITVRQANERGFAPGTEIPLGYWNQVTQQWEHAGTGVVDASGQWVEMEATHFSNYDCNDPIADPDLDAQGFGGDGKDGPCNGVSGCFISYKSGRLEEWIDLPAQTVLGDSVAPQLSYSTERTVPSEVIDIRLNVTRIGSVQLGDFIEWELFIEGQSTDKLTFAANYGEDGEIGRYRYYWDGRNAQGDRLPSGSYKYAVLLSIPYIGEYCYALNGIFGNPPDCVNGATGIFVDAVKEVWVEGTVALISQEESPLGQGWNLSGLQRLYEDDAALIMIDEGDSSPAEYYFPGRILLENESTYRTTSNVLNLNLGASSLAPAENLGKPARGSQKTVPSSVSPLGDNEETVATEDVMRSNFPAQPPHSATEDKFVHDYSAAHEVEADLPLSNPLPSMFYTAAPMNTIVSDTITADTTWTAAGSPYDLINNIEVTAGVTLTIESGVTVRGANERGLYISGNLQSLGTASQPITMTAISGRWDGLRFYPGSQGTLDYVNILDTAGNNGLTGAAITADNAVLDIQHTDIISPTRYNAPVYGLYLTNDSQVTFADSTVRGVWDTAGSDYGVGIRVYSSAITLTNATVRDNEKHGIWAGAGSQVTMNQGTVAGNRNGLAGSSSSYNLSGVTFDGNNYPIYDDADNLAITLSGATIQNGATLGRFDMDTLMQLLNDPGNSFSNISQAQVDIVGGTVTTHTTWLSNADLNIYRLVRNNIDVTSGVTLTVESGVTVRGANERGLYVSGNLQALGTVSQPITMTAISGRWDGLRFYPGSQGTLDYVNILDTAGNNGLTGAAITADNAVLDIQHTDIVSPTRYNAPVYGLYLTNDSQVTFADSAVRGVWDTAGTDYGVGIRVYSSAITLTNATVRDNEKHGIWAGAGSQVTMSQGTVAGNRNGLAGSSSSYNLSGVTFDGNNYPIYDDADNLAITLSGATIQNGATLGRFDMDTLMQLLNDPSNSFSNISQAQVDIVGGTVTTHTTWLSNADLNIYRLVRNNIDVTSGVMLTVESGVTVRGANERGLYISGNLQALGTVSQPITMTAISGKWDGLRFYPGSQGALDYVNILDTAGDNGLTFAAITADNAVLDIQHTDIVSPTTSNATVYGLYVTNGSQVTFADSTVRGAWNSASTAGGVGIRVYGSTITLIKATIRDNEKNGIYAEDSTVNMIGGSLENNQEYGLRASGDSTVMLRLVNIENNGSYGVYNDGSQVVDARYSWWGSPYGPYHPDSNPGGQGDRVSYNVTFDPWSREPIVGLGPVFNNTATDHSRLTYDEDTDTYTRIYADGTQVHFNPDGTHDYTLATDGRKTTYTHNPDGSVATMGVVLPGEETPRWTWTFSYQPAASRAQLAVDRKQKAAAGDQQMLSAEGQILVTDPAGRVTTFALDANNNLVAVTYPDGATRQYAYDQNSLLTHATDENGAVTSHTYDDYGRVSSVTAPARAVYDPDSGQTEIVQEVRTFTPSDTGYPLINDSPPGDPDNPAPAVPLSDELVDQVTYGRGSISGHTNEWGSWLDETDGEGRTTTYQRDRANNLTRADYADGNCVEYTYDYLGNMLTEERMGPAQCALPREARDPAQVQSWIYTYEESFNQVKTETDPLGNVTTYVYDYEEAVGEAGNLVRIEYPPVTDEYGAVVYPDLSFAYNAWGLLESVTDERGIITQFVYTQGTADEASGGANPLFAPGVGPVPGLLTQVIENVGAGGHLNLTAIYKEFDAAGNPQLIIEPRGEQFRYEYDALDRVVREENGLGLVTTYAYDDRGNVINMVEGDGTSERQRITSYSYNAHDQITEMGVAGDNIVYEMSYVYDINRQLAQTRDNQGRTTIYEYDNADQLVAVTDPLGQTTTFSYTLQGDLSSQTYPDGRTVTFDYDERSNLTSLIPPGQPAHSFDYTQRDLVESYTPPDVGIGNTATTYTYNAMHQAMSETRPDSNQIQLLYDAAQRLHSITIPRGTITYGYDLDTSQLTSIATPDGVLVNYGYDGELLSSMTWSGPVDGNVGFSYDDYYRITEETVNGGDPVTFAYSEDHLLTQVGDMSLARMPQTGLLSGSTLGAVADALTYSPFGELSNYNALAGSSELFDVSYTYDDLQRIKTLTETINGQTFAYRYEYDSSGRLTHVYLNGTLQQSYTYDDNGNRLSFTDDNGTLTGTYDDQDRVLNYGGTSYAYTPNGELASETTGTSTTLYDYDEFSNLLGVTLADGTEISYLVDGENQRVGKQTDGTLTQGFLYQDTLNPIAELNGSGNVVNRFIYGSRVNVPDYMLKGGETYRIVADHLGSVRLVVNTTSGAIAQQLNYDAFGRVTLDTNPGFQPFGFAGGIYDVDTGLVRFGTRDNISKVGRWTTKDPIGFNGGDVNLYGYALSDPVNLVDSDGKKIVGWIIKLTDKGYKKIKPLFSLKEARHARRQGKQVLAIRKQTSGKIERGAFPECKQLKHPGHDLPGGRKGMPHFQTNRKMGHSFWKKAGTVLGAILTFIAESIVSPISGGKAWAPRAGGK